MTTQTTPRPWHAAQGYTSGCKRRLPYVSIWAGKNLIQVHGENPVEKVDNAALICRAVNSHDALVEALKGAICDIEVELCAASDSLDHPTFKAKAKNVKRYKAALKLAEVQP